MGRSTSNGKAITFTNKKFNLVLNILIGINKTLSDIDQTDFEIEPDELDYSRRFMNESPWYS